MTTSDERMKILKMIQDGKISAEEGMQLLAVLEGTSKVKGHETSSTSAGKGGRFIRILVTNSDTGKTKVNVRMPISVVSAGVKMGARFSPQVEGLDVNELMGFIQSGETGKIIDVYDDEDREHVEIYIE